MRRLDDSAGGIGGYPFAPGAAGNVTVEDLVRLARKSGLHTGIDMNGLRIALKNTEYWLTKPLGGRTIT